MRKPSIQHSVEWQCDKVRLKLTCEKMKEGWENKMQSLLVKDVFAKNIIHNE